MTATSTFDPPATVDLTTAFDPTPAPGPASAPDLAGALAALDHLAGSGFPVDQATIVGEDVRVVETSPAASTAGGLVAAGALQGLWIGVALGLILALLLPLTLVGLLLAIAVPVVASAAFAVIMAPTRLSPTEVVAATSYAVTVPPDLADRANLILFCTAPSP